MKEPQQNFLNSTFKKFFTALPREIKKEVTWSKSYTIHLSNILIWRDPSRLPCFLLFSSGAYAPRRTLVSLSAINLLVLLLFQGRQWNRSSNYRLPKGLRRFPWADWISRTLHFPICFRTIDLSSVELATDRSRSSGKLLRLRIFLFRQ